MNTRHNIQTHTADTINRNTNNVDAPSININESLLRPHLVGIPAEFRGEAVAVQPRSSGERERAHVLKATPDEKTRCEPWPEPKNGGGADGPEGPGTLDDVIFVGSRLCSGLSLL